MMGRIERSIDELYRDDPQRADALAFGRETGASRRGFLGGAGLAAMTAAVGGVAQQGMSRRQWDETLTLMNEKHNMPKLDGKERETVLNYLEAPIRRPRSGARAAGRTRSSIADFVLASTPDAARWRPVLQRLPQQMIFRRRRQERLALPAEAAAEFGLREQRGDLGFAAGGQQCQPVECAGQRAALDEIRSALAKPAGQLQPRIIIAAHESEAMPGYAFGGREADHR